MTVPEDAQPAPLGEEGGLQEQDQIHLNDTFSLNDSPACAAHTSADLDVETQVREAAERIRRRMSRAAQDIVDIGRDLIIIKELVGHGNFLRWIDTEFQMSDQTAANFMNVARRFGDQIPNGLEFQPSALYALAAPSTPDSVVEVAVERAAAGQRVTRDDIQALKGELEAAGIATFKERQEAILAEIANNPDGKRALKQVAKQVRAADQKAAHEERQHKLEAIAARNPELPTGRLHSVVLIDVPRHHNVYSDTTGSENAPENHFPTMSFAELCDFPIDEFAAPDSTILYWSTAASLLDDLDILAEWGFVALRSRDSVGDLVRDGGVPLPPVGAGRYGSHQIWRKQRIGKQTGMGRWFRDQHEILIVARRGNAPAPLPGTQDESVFDAPIGEHSEKPNKHVRAWIDRCWPHLEKVEVFARGTAPPGWKFWGNQTEQHEVRAGGAELVVGEVVGNAPTTWIEAAAAAIADEVEVDHRETEQEPVEEDVDEPQRAAKPPKLATHESDLRTAVDHAFEEIAELASECRDVVEGAPDGLRETERIQALEATADSLEGLETPHIESDELSGIAVTYTTVLPKRKHRGLSRASRMSNAVSTIEACIEALEAVAEGDPHHAAAQALLDDLNNAVSEAEGREFPGMFG